MRKKDLQAAIDDLQEQVDMLRARLLDLEMEKSGTPPYVPPILAHVSQFVLWYLSKLSIQDSDNLDQFGIIE